MKTLQAQAKALINASSSSEDFKLRQMTPSKPSARYSSQRPPNLQFDTSHGSEMKWPNSNPTNKGILKSSLIESKKSASKKVTLAKQGGCRQHLLDMKKQLNDENSKVQVLQEEIDRVNMDRSELQKLNLDYANKIDVLQSQIQQFKEREHILIDQLQEQTSLTKEALIQAQETRICMEESQIGFVDNMRKEQQEKKVMKAELELHFSKLMEEKLLTRSKEIAYDLQKRYEQRIHVIEKENDDLRVENIQLQKKLINSESKKYSSALDTRRFTQDETDIFSKLRQFERFPQSKQEQLENEIRGLQVRLDSMGKGKLY